MEFSRSVFDAIQAGRARSFCQQGARQGDTNGRDRAGRRPDGNGIRLFSDAAGVRVTLIERNRVGTGATVASFGNVRRTGRCLPQLPLAHRSRAIWGAAEKLLGRDVEFRATGHLRLIFEQESLVGMHAFAEAARPWGLDIEELGPNELAQRFPGLGPGAIGASFSPKDGCGNPRLISPAFAAVASKLGAAIVEEAGDARVEKTAAGFRVVTARGDYAAECLLNTAGAWGARFAAQFGEHVPLVARGPQMGVTEPLPHRVLPVVGIWTRMPGQNGYLRQVERGNIVFGGATERVHVPVGPGHAKADPARLPGQLRAIARLLPAIARVAIIRTWSGCGGYVADDLPVIGRSATTPGLFHAFGFCGHGFQLGPGVGNAMAEMIVTGTCETPLEYFRIDRFAQPA